MFRLANFDDETKDDENGIYRFISSAVSTTITDCLDEYLIDPESYRIYFGMFFEGGFFEGLSRYITPDVSLVYAGDPDNRAGYGFTLAKMKRMKDKMLDQQNFYTFDVFEEKVLFCMCEVIALRDRTAAGRKRREPLKKKVEEARTRLREEFKASAGNANDFSRKMYYASAMRLKDNEDDNLIFWDDDYDFFWRDGFVKGIGYLKTFEGQNAGYGYDYTCRIFTDIGLKPPLLLLGSEEANKIVTEMQGEQFRNHINQMFGGIQAARSPENTAGKEHTDENKA